MHGLPIQQCTSTGCGIFQYREEVNSNLRIDFQIRRDAIVEKPLQIVRIAKYRAKHDVVAETANNAHPEEAKNG
jgi:hypothetical protein